MTAEPTRRGLLDTDIMILRSLIAPEELPDEMAISAVTLAELLISKSRRRRWLGACAGSA